MFNLLFGGIIFLLGLCIGSFLNVVSDRLPKNKSLGGRSHCDHCKKMLSGLDLIPVFSFLFLRGRCRYCKKKISVKYIFVELLTGILFLFIFLVVPPQFTFLSLSLFFSLLVIYSCLIGILSSDVKYRIIPDELTGIFLVFTLYIRFVTHTLFWESLLSGIILCSVFLILYVITRGRGMGMGDVKFAFPMGIFLGFPYVIVGFYVAFLTGALISIILIIVGKKRFGQTIAFGPFLVFATIVSNFFGQPLWDIFQKLLGF